jgi:UDP-glucose 4-epimerase
MTILITGGAGYIGSHLVKALQTTDHIVVIDLLDQKSKANNHVLNLNCDIRNRIQLESVFKQHKFDLIYHLAALKSVVNEDHNALFSTNVSGFENLLSFIDAETSIVFTSSAAVYQSKPNSLPIKEDELCRPISLYGKTKLLGEDLLNYHTGNSISLRLFNVAGKVANVKYESADINVLPNFLRKIYSKEPLQIFGNSFSTRDGYAVRDYIHISDVVSALVKAGEALSSRRLDRSEQFNVSSGIGTSVLELVKLIELRTHLKSELAIKAPRDSEIPLSIGSSEKFKLFTDWQVQHLVQDIIRSEIEFYNQKI